MCGKGDLEVEGSGFERMLMQGETLGYLRHQASYIGLFEFSLFRGVELVKHYRSSNTITSIADGLAALVRDVVCSRVKVTAVFRVI